jgi:hypothetical protein
MALYLGLWMAVLYSGNYGGWQMEWRSTTLFFDFEVGPAKFR